MKTSYLRSFGILVSCLIFTIAIHSALWAGDSEGGVYLAYTQSFLQDGDLNIINNVPPQMAWLSSSTGNYPDMHDHGILLLWAPFLFLFRLLSPFFTEVTATFSLLAASLTLSISGAMLMKSYLGEKLNSLRMKILFISFFFISPVVHYTLFEYTVNDLAAFFFSAAVINFGLKRGINTIGDAFIWGVAAGLAWVLKISFIFYVPFFLSVLFHEKKWKHALPFILGFLPLFLLKALNAKLQFGVLSFLTGYDYDFAFPKPPFWEYVWRNLFGPYGLFHTAPWLAFMGGIWLLFVVHLWKKKDKKLLPYLTLGLAILAKFYYITSYSISPSEANFGYRRFLIDTPFIGIMFIEFLSLPGLSKRTQNLVMALFGVCGLWNLYYFWWYQDILFFHDYAFGAHMLWETGSVFESFVFASQRMILWFQNFFSHEWKSVIFTTILLAPALVVYKLRSKMRIETLFLGLAFFYFVVTMSNFRLNQKNVEKLRINGFYNSVVEGSGFGLYLYEEILSDLGKVMVTAKYTKDHIEYERIRMMLLDYFKEIPNSVTKDPRGFLLSLETGNPPAPAFEHRLDAKSIFDPKAPTYFDRAFAKENSRGTK